jgi:Beta galactosidase small chain
VAGVLNADAFSLCLEYLSQEVGSFTARSNVHQQSLRALLCQDVVVTTSSTCTSYRQHWYMHFVQTTLIKQTMTFLYYTALLLLQTYTQVLARVGIRLLLPASFSELQYYGRGPYENYSDRNTSTAVDLYTSSVKDQFVSYVRPGECGAKTDVRWLELSDPLRRVTLSCASAEPFTFSSHRLLCEDMAVRHPGNVSLQPVELSVCCM